MTSNQFSAPVARAALRLIPSPLLQRLLDALLRGMRHGHPGLFRNLARLGRAVIRVEPSDLAHRFILEFGQGQTVLTLADSRSLPCDACVKGKLAALLALLEGRVDSDRLFFSRDIEITGDTSVVVALRNTLDREEIELLDDVTALCGPFARPARGIVLALNEAAERVKNRLAEIYEERRPVAADAKLECDKLRGEIQTLKTRLAKFEIRQRRMESAAS